MNTMDSEQNESTAEAIKKAEKNFALDLPLLVDETARDIKILNTIAAIEKQQLESIFLTISSAPTAPLNQIWTVVLQRQDNCSRKYAVDHHCHAAPRTHLHSQDGPISRSFLVAWHYTEKYREKRKHARVAEPQVRISLHKSRKRKNMNLKS